MDDKPPNFRNHFIGLRVNDEEKALVQQAAEREGLQISSFIIMLLVRLHILPESSMAKIKRRPVAQFTALHALLGVVNKIGGNCKQLTAALPDTAGVDDTHQSLIRAASAITDALQGQKIPEGVNLYRMQEDVTKAGNTFNAIVRSVNQGNPQLRDLPQTLALLRNLADSMTVALSGGIDLSRLSPDEVMELAMAEMRSFMRNRQG